MTMNILQWLTQQLPQNISGPAAFFLIVTLVSYMLGKHRQKQEHKKIREGRFNTTILIQACLLRKTESGKSVLLLRNLFPPFQAYNLSIPRVLLKLLEKKSLATAIDTPLLDLDQSDPDQELLLHMLRNHVLGSCNTLHGAMGKWLVFLTSEMPGEYVKRNFVRVLLIKEEDLERFKRLEDALKVELEFSEHWFRVLTLHLLANQDRTFTAQLPIEHPDWNPLEIKTPDWSNQVMNKALLQIKEATKQ
jgi:hypothetical protein